MNSSFVVNSAQLEKFVSFKSGQLQIISQVQILLRKLMNDQLIIQLTHHIR